MNFGIRTLRLGMATRLVYYTPTPTGCHSRIKLKFIIVRVFLHVFINIQEHSDNCDFSEYPVNNPYYSTENKKVVGKFKDECSGETYR